MILFVTWRLMYSFGRIVFAHTQTEARTHGREREHINACFYLTGSFDRGDITNYTINVMYSLTLLSEDSVDSHLYILFVFS